MGLLDGEGCDDNSEPTGEPPLDTPEPYPEEPLSLPQKSAGEEFLSPIKNSFFMSAKGSSSSFSADGSRFTLREEARTSGNCVSSQRGDSKYLVSGPLIMDM